MTPTAPLPAQQRDRLKLLHNRQRVTLRELVAAEAAQAKAEQAAAEAQRAAKDSKAQTETAYRALVALVGPAAAAELTGRSPAERHTSRPPASTGEPPLVHDGNSIEC
jgi:hypothetical protein